MKILFPIYKIKSPSYVAVHHLRGEGLCPKKIGRTYPHKLKLMNI